MKSPFPGMDPYIESSGRWRSFHSRLINRIVDMLETQLPAKYTVLPDAREYIERDEEFRELFVEIVVKEPEFRLISCIEALLESNKGRKGSGREMYLRKREAMLLSDCNFVEIDLLREGEPMPMQDPWPDSPYRMLVSRGQRNGNCLVWTGHYLKPLPSIPVPLDGQDSAIRLELQPMVENIYQRSRYYQDLDYSKPLAIPLPEADQAWLQEQLKNRSV